MVNKIKSTIDNNGFTVKEVINRANISKSYFYDVMKGKTIPSINKANDIAKALDTTVQELFLSEEV